MSDGWDVEYSEKGRAADRVYWSHLAPEFRTRLEIGGPWILGRKAALACARDLLDSLRETYPKAAVFLDGVRVRMLDPDQRIEEKARQVPERPKAESGNVQLTLRMGRKDGGKSSGTTETQRHREERL